MCPECDAREATENRNAPRVPVLCLVKEQTDVS